MDWVHAADVRSCEHDDELWVPEKAGSLTS